ncbi:PE domain-containing protein [Hoyosella sp. G463]|uniref:PE domain-containing protein n=1 Tax=Lolliginicoccus lacisalsi TaxID=2742202 RepID=A0A927JD67_9ACTN|nr:PE domain-containing protein [Lolliginicoccus lacisalsi]
MAQELSVDPEALRAAAAELDAAATRIDSELARARGSAAPPPGAADEVTVASTRWISDAFARTDPALVSALRELREAARTLRHQAATYTEQDGAASRSIASHA